MLTEERKIRLFKKSEYDLQEEFISACANGELEVVQFLLDNFEKKIDTNIENNYAFRIACHNGHINVIDYLLTCPRKYNNKKGYIDNYSLNNIFLVLCGNFKKYNDIISYLIIEYEIPISYKLRQLFYQEQYQPIEELFKKRELNKNLSKNLNNKARKITNQAIETINKI